MTEQPTPSNPGKTPLIPAATVYDGSIGEDGVEVRHSKRRKSCPAFSLLQLNKKIDGQLKSSFSFTFPTDELTNTTPEVTPKFGSFNPGHGSSESGQVPVKSRGVSDGITEVEDAAKI